MSTGATVIIILVVAIIVFTIAAIWAGPSGKGQA